MSDFNFIDRTVGILFDRIEELKSSTVQSAHAKRIAQLRSKDYKGGEKGGSTKGKGVIASKVIPQYKKYAAKRGVDLTVKHGSTGEKKVKAHAKDMKESFNNFIDRTVGILMGKLEERNKANRAKVKGWQASKGGGDVYRGRVEIKYGTTPTKAGGDHANLNNAGKARRVGFKDTARYHLGKVTGKK